MALVTYERDGEIATITLNRPDKLNAFSDELVGALGEELHRFDMDDQAHVAILCGNGRAFSSGADVKQRQLRSREEFLRLGGPQGRGTHSSDLLTKAVNWKPVIAAPHGYVLGLSVGIVLECDLIVAEEGTRFQVTETSRGLGASKYWSLMHFRGGAARNRFKVPIPAHEFAGFVVASFSVGTVEEEAFDFVGGVERVAFFVVEFSGERLQRATDVGFVGRAVFVDDFTEDEHFAGTEDVGRTPVKR